MEVLNEGCPLGLLVQAATVPCSSSAYRLCNCYYFFFWVSLSSSIPPFVIFQFFMPTFTSTSSILHAYVHVYVFNLHVFTSTFTFMFNSTSTKRKILVLIKCKESPWSWWLQYGLGDCNTKSPQKTRWKQRYVIVDRFFTSTFTSSILYVDVHNCFQFFTSSSRLRSRLGSRSRL